MGARYCDIAAFLARRNYEMDKKLQPWIFARFDYSPMPQSQRWFSYG